MTAPIPGPDAGDATASGESPRIAIVGRGRMGHALAAALPGATGPHGHGFDGSDHEVVVLAVPDDEIGNAASCIVSGRIVGHCSGASGLDALAPHEGFGLHPLMTVTKSGADFSGAGAAIAGTSPRALAVAQRLAGQLGMHSFQLDDNDRGAYHAAASIASNFLVTLEDAAEMLLATTGGDRQILVPLVRAALDNWAAAGGQDAITGPIARGDEATVERQRRAIAERTPELLILFDVMCERTRALVERTESDV